jgi:hypothetical protein
MVNRLRSHKGGINEPVILVGDFTSRDRGLRPSTIAATGRGGGSRAGIASKHDDLLRWDVRW